MYALNVKLEFQEETVFLYLDDKVDDKEPTDLDAEAKWLCTDFINMWLIDNDAVENIWTKDNKEIDKLQGFIKHLVYLKRHKPDAYEKLKEEYDCY